MAKEIGQQYTQLSAFPTYSNSCNAVHKKEQFQRLAVIHRCDKGV